MSDFPVVDARAPRGYTLQDAHAQAGNVSMAHLILKRRAYVTARVNTHQQLGLPVTVQMIDDWWREAFAVGTRPAEASMSEPSGKEKSRLVEAFQTLLAIMGIAGLVWLYFVM
ncbi:hypothetical protein [Filomicrobium sp.]|uniref:hypothetical protein n=1 Tax=Filomicrobium sp. TaxID=2024831 RepID=UPI002582C832|nr:hypothetical protein [Filomicrobium sp.]MCV0371842.1 hypothetical protein [Filomicrobium sp.]